MTLKWNGVEWNNGSYFYWFDLNSVSENRLIGFECITMSGRKHTWLCFWFFNIGWSFF